MAVKIRIKTVKVIDADGEEIAEVRGLSPNDFFELYNLHKPVMEQAYSRFAEVDAQYVTEQDFRDMAGEAIQHAPALLAHVIAIGADDRENFDEILKMPVGDQIECVTKIMELTFTSGFGPKKLLALIEKMQRNVQSQ
jgi:hypothetical protein